MKFLKYALLKIKDSFFFLGFLTQVKKSALL